MNQNEWLIIGGLGLLYFLTRSSNVYPQTYPQYPRTSGTGTGTGSTNRPSGGGSGGSIGGGGSGGGTSPGGTVAVPPNTNNSVNNGDGTYTCDDGSIQGDPSLCPITYTCPDGTIVTDLSQCPQQYQCADGTNVSDPSQCPDLQSGGTIPVDSGNVCDPSSVAYDASACASSGA